MFAANVVVASSFLVQGVKEWKGWRNNEREEVAKRKKD
jgi:hypothetical protein